MKPESGLDAGGGNGRLTRAPRPPDGAADVLQPRGCRGQANKMQDVEGLSWPPYEEIASAQDGDYYGLRE